MGARSVRVPLRSAIEDLEAAEEHATDADVAAYLSGVLQVLEFGMGGTAVEPEAVIHPQPWTLSTIERRLADMADGLDPAVAERLRSAVASLEEARSIVEDQYAGGRPPRV